MNTKTNTNNKDIVDKNKYKENEENIRKRSDSVERWSFCEETLNSTSLDSTFNLINELSNKNNKVEINIISSNNTNNEEKKHLIHSLLSKRIKKKSEQDNVKGKEKGKEIKKEKEKEKEEEKEEEREKKKEKEKEKEKKKVKKIKREELKKVNFTEKFINLKSAIFKSSVINCSSKYACTDVTDIECINDEKQTNGIRKQLSQNECSFLDNEKNNKINMSYPKYKKNYITKNRSYICDSNEMEKQETHNIGESYINTGKEKEDKEDKNDKKDKKDKKEGMQRNKTMFQFLGINNINNKNEKNRNIKNIYLNDQNRKCTCYNTSIINENFTNVDCEYKHENEHKNVYENVYEKEHEIHKKNNNILKQKRSGRIWKIKKNKNKYISCDEQKEEINLIHEKTSMGTKKGTFLTNKMRKHKNKYKGLGDSDFTWDPQNPLNVIGPHAKCHGLRCDYIFFPPINFKEMKKKKKSTYTNTHKRTKRKENQNINQLENNKCCHHDKNEFANEAINETNETDTKKKRKKKKKKKKKGICVNSENSGYYESPTVNSKCQENKIISSDESINVKNNNLKILKHYYIKSAKILFNEPRVMVDTYKRLNNCCYSLCMKINHVSFVTMSDHYAVKVDLRLKKNVKMNRFEMDKNEDSE